VNINAALARSRDVTDGSEADAAGVTPPTILSSTLPACRSCSSPSRAKQLSETILSTSGQLHPSATGLGRRRRDSFTLWRQSRQVQPTSTSRRSILRDFANDVVNACRSRPHHPGRYPEDRHLRVHGQSERVARRHPRLQRYADQDRQRHRHLHAGRADVHDGSPRRPTSFTSTERTPCFWRDQGRCCLDLSIISGIKQLLPSVTRPCRRA